MILIKKAIRSMLSNKRAYIACIVLLAIGIIIYCSMGISIDTLEVRKDEYYKEYELAKNWWKADFCIKNMIFLREFLVED